MSAMAQRAARLWPEQRTIKMWDGEVALTAWEEADATPPAVHYAHANGFNALTYR